MRRYCSAALLSAAFLAGWSGSGGAASPATPEGRLAFRLAEGKGFAVTDLEGRTLRTLRAPGRKVVARPVFDETGRRVWFLSEARGRLWLETRSLTDRGASASSPLPFSSSGAPGFAVSRTGKRVAVNGVAFGKRLPCGEGALVSSSGRLLRRFHEGRAVRFRLGPWSRAGTRLAYVRGGCNTKYPEDSLFVAGPGTREIRVAHPFTSEVTDVAWDPAGRRIAYTSCPDDCPLRVVRLGTRASRVLARGGGTLVAWTTRTDEIVYRQDYPSTRFVAVRANGGAMRELRYVDEVETSSPDGNRLLIRGSDGRRAVMVVRTGRRWLLPDAVQQRLPARPGAVTYFVR